MYLLPLDIHFDRIKNKIRQMGIQIRIITRSVAKTDHTVALENSYLLK